MCTDYGKTLNLPKTDFPMRGGLVQKEPLYIDKWNKENLYNKIIEKNKDKTKYIVHDGPPYANADIHLGTALNKILKDIIVKYKNMTGYFSPYIPGFDTHGLPIELRVIKEYGQQNVISLREKCKEFALKYVDVQKNQFIRLGVVGDFDNPYLTLNHEYESEQVKVFGEMAKNGYIYKGLKPVYWCADCSTALAESEIEYENDPCYSIFVKFYLKDDKGKFFDLGIDTSKISFLIWTTTTWTLPANVAICVSPDYEYSLVKVNDEYIIMAKELIEDVFSNIEYNKYEIVRTFKGKDLELIETRHPFLDRSSVVILGDHVTLDTGTGCVHTAPGHGVEDYEVIVKRYSYIPIIVPVDENGILTDEAGQFSGLSVLSNEAGREIANYLKDNNYLFATKKITHQYPHCWRCKNPILFRATEQWFCSIEKFRQDALKNINDVNWIPVWGESRMSQMISDRSDWCISRQRVWGVPIPIFYCDSCNTYHIDDITISCVSNLFLQFGSSAWFEKEASEILPKDYKCKKCGNDSFYKETDIMDVWFDSGVSHTSVLKANTQLNFPADLYLEGHDQYRGWFQSSLLTSTAIYKKSPYKSVCTHGWVVDGDGRKMSKSLGNGIDPNDVVNKYGADILRLWAVFSDYHADIRISDNILKQITEAYRKIRNTARFMLASINDFDPNIDIIDINNLEEIDKYALIKYNELLSKVKNAYETLNYHIIYHSVYNFCVVDMSNFYLDILKDRLYVEKTNSSIRRSAQSSIYLILSGLVKLMAPILTFTCEEIWSYIPHLKNENKDFILLNDIDKEIKINDKENILNKYELIFSINEYVKKSLENARQEKVIGSSLDAKITFYFKSKEKYDLFFNFKDELNKLFIVSEFCLSKTIINGEIFDEGEIVILVEKASGSKCERCWNYTNDIGYNEKYPNICKRCTNVLL